jgi:hypothetical protein
VEDVGAAQKKAAEPKGKHRNQRIIRARGWERIGGNVKKKEEEEIH